MAEQTPLTLNLVLNEKTAIETMLNRVWEKFGGQVLRSALCGSKESGYEKAD